MSGDGKAMNASSRFEKLADIYPVYAVTKFFEIFGKKGASLVDNGLMIGNKAVGGKGGGFIFWQRNEVGKKAS